MKKNITLTLLLFTGIMAFSQARKIKTSDIKGTWVLNYTTTLASLDEKGLARYEALPEVTKEHLHTGMEGITVTFHPNGSYLLSSQAGDQVEGNWQWLEDGATLKITETHGREYEQGVIGLSAENLILHVAEVSDTRVIFHRWYLDKQ